MYKKSHGSSEISLYSGSSSNIRPTKSGTYSESAFDFPSNSPFVKYSDCQLQICLVYDFAIFTPLAKMDAWLLERLDKLSIIEDSDQLTFQDSQPDKTELSNLLKSLSSREIVEFSNLEKEEFELTEEGKEIALKGSHEARVFEAVPKGDSGLPISSLASLVGQETAKIGQNQAFKNKWIGKKENNLIRLVDSITDETRNVLVSLKTKEHDQSILAELKKRKLIDKKKILSFKIKKGSKFSLQVEKLATDLTFEMLTSGDYKNQSFKKYNFDACGLAPESGHLHPLLKVREEFRKIFLEMGFSEMPTNRYVESSFWNFDALFQPQQHPSREAHDTFFLKSPATSLNYPRDYMERVKQVHSAGGYGSLGYRYEWKEQETSKNILRTHTTAISTRMLYKLAQEKTFRPVKYFSIDKVFRNESVDATHLAEFNQIEGLIADYNLTLCDLIGTLQEFFYKLGIKKIRFKPAYNPYTEPSMEIFAYHEGMKKWMEVANSGVFRPEMLQPMGFDEKVSVIAWGLGLERPAMIKYQVSNIRDLVGHKVDLQMIKSNPICRLDK